MNRRDVEAYFRKNPLSNRLDVKELLDRIDEFFRDKDTFDLFPKRVTP